MVFRIKIADVVIEINSIYNVVGYNCYDYFAAQEKPEVFISVDQKDIDNERLIFEKKANTNTFAPGERQDCNLEPLAVYRKISEQLLDYGTVLMHGSVVAVNDKAFLFTAPSGTGKTTHANLWVEYIEDAYILNGDKPLLRIEDEGVMAFGTPWSGKECVNRNAKVPLKAIFLLERGTDNSVKEIPFLEAYPQLYQQCYRPKTYDKGLKTIQLLEKINKNVRFFRLVCNMDKSAAIMAYNAVKEM